MFLVHTSDCGAVQPWEYLTAAAGEYQAGQLVNVTGGNVTALTGASTTTPGYICMASVKVEHGELVPVTRVSRDAVYETTLSAEAASAKVGSKVQVSAGGLQVDAGAVGTFELCYMDGTAAGDMVRGRFL